MEENKAGWRHSISDHTVFNNAAWNEIKSLFVFLSTKISLKCIFYQIDLYIVLALLFGIENRRSLLIVHKRICRKLSSSLISAAMFTRNCLLTDPVRNKTKRTDQTEPMVTFFAGLILHSSKTFFWTDWLSVKTTTYFRLGFDKSSSNTLTNKLSLEGTVPFEHTWSRLRNTATGTLCQFVWP